MWSDLRVSAGEGSLKTFQDKILTFVKANKVTNTNANASVRVVLQHFQYFCPGKILFVCV